MPEANMLPNVKGFKVFSHLSLMKGSCLFLQIQNFVFSVGLGTQPCTGHLCMYIVFKTYPTRTGSDSYMVRIH